MKHKFSIATTFMIALNFILRLIYINYGYIPSEEGILIYQQKLAFQGLMPFIDYNGWNSLINNYIVGFYQFFISPTIMTQRIYGLLSSLLVLILTLDIAKRLNKAYLTLLTAVLLTFGSLSYLYYSNIPYSSQTMSVFLVISVWFLSRTLTNKHAALNYLLALTFAIIAVVVRTQALPALFIIWIYVAHRLRKRIWTLTRISLLAIGIWFLLYAPFIFKSVDHFLYSQLWPFRAHEILVYQYGKILPTITDFINYIIFVFIEYGFLIIIVGSAFLVGLYNWKIEKNKLPKNPNRLYVVVLLLIGLGVAFPSLVHKPPYSTYIYPAVPILAIFGGFYLLEYLPAIERGHVLSRQVFFALLGILALHNFILFPHTDYMKTELKTIKQTPYSLLKEIIAYVETKTTPGGEVLSFYLPAAAQSGRIIPINLNEGEGSISILNDAEASKYHLTNINQLKEYILSRQAQAIVMTSITPRFFGVNQSEKEAVMSAIANHYYLDKTFTNFAQIGNPTVKELYVYLRKNN